MSAPTPPTLVSITTEALKKAGYSNPATQNAALLTRSQDEWMEEVKNDIFTIAKKLKYLQTTSVMITTQGISRYSMPTDYSSGLTMQLLDGNRSGISQGGAAGSLTLAATDTAAESDIVGKRVLITSGTAKASMSQSSAYNAGTKVVTVSPDFNTAPVNLDNYLIIDSYTKLRQKPIQDLRGVGYAAEKGEPTHYFPIGDDNDGEFELFPAPYRNSAVPWGIEFTYYADLGEVDLASTLMATLYKRFRNVFFQGVYAKALQSNNDKRAKGEMQEYKSTLLLLNIRETYGMDLSNLQCTVSDY